MKNYIIAFLLIATAAYGNKDTLIQDLQQDFDRALETGDIFKLRELKKNNFPMLAPQGTGKEQNFSIHRAAGLGKANVVRFFIEECGVDANLRNGIQHTPLISAVAANQENVVDCLLSCPTVDITCQDVCGNSAITLARAFSLKSITRSLAYHAAVKNQQTTKQ